MKKASLKLQEWMEIPFLVHCLCSSTLEMTIYYVHQPCFSMVGIISNILDTQMLGFLLFIFLTENSSLSQEYPTGTVSSLLTALVILQCTVLLLPSTPDSLVIDQELEHGLSYSFLCSLLAKLAGEKNKTFCQFEQEKKKKIP